MKVITKNATFLQINISFKNGKLFCSAKATRLDI